MVYSKERTYNVNYSANKMPSLVLLHTADSQQRLPVLPEEAKPENDTEISLTVMYREYTKDQNWV